MRDLLIKRGIQNLKTYGYPKVNEKNILTDQIYSAFFLEMLKDNLGHGHDEPIKALIAEIKPTS